MHIYSVCVTSVKAQSPISHNEGNRGAVDVDLPTPALPKPSTSLTKGSCGRSEKVC